MCGGCRSNNGDSDDGCFVIWWNLHYMVNFYV
ncbi:hypothetical protein SEVIR_3G314603v4 [Setaria viridis]